MKSKFAILFTLVAAAAINGLAQLPPPPTPAASPTPQLSEQFSKVLESMKAETPTPREQREMAYAKLLEGQRYIWSGDRLRSRAGRQNNARLAREAFRKSVELDPRLSEGYTALAELAVNTLPQDPDEAVRLALLGTKVNPNNFGARRILARLYTIKSRVIGGPFDATSGRDAITEWNHVVRLDPRNAEAWALLSELYDKTNSTAESIDSLQKWLSSAVPVDTRFYQSLTGGQNLTPENASVKLGSMLLKAGRTREAIATLSVLIADEPGNFLAVDLLRDAIEDANPEMASLAIESLGAAVNSNPGNVSLINLLARVHVKAGKIDDAVKVLRDSSTKLLPTDRAAAAMLQISLGDMMARADRHQDAMAAYEGAFNARGLDHASTLADDEREFATHVFEKMIHQLKNSDRPAEARTVIERARKLLGKDDLFADRQLIALLRETGERSEALAVIKSVRQRVPSDYGFIRLEATLLTETGKVDEGVALIRKLIDTSATAPASVPSATPGRNGNESVTIAVPTFDTFSNYLFISNLYSQANRGKEAAEAANQAYAIARGSERKQIARLTLATAQQNSGDFKGAETTLRDLLKETPGNPIALNNLGYFLLERDDRLEEAFDLIQQAVKIDPTNPSYLDSLGWAYFKLGKLNDAEKYLKDALRIDASSGTINEHLGDVYQKQGRMDLAKASWSKSASLYSDAADVARVKKKLVSGK